MGDVARVYLNKFSFLEERYPDFTSKVERIGTALVNGNHMPPLLIMAGRKPNSLSLVDGNFRALALMVQDMTKPGSRDWKIEACIGRKLYPWELLSEIKNMLRSSSSAAADFRI